MDTCDKGGADRPNLAARCEGLFKMDGDAPFWLSHTPSGIKTVAGPPLASGDFQRDFKHFLNILAGGIDLHRIDRRHQGRHLAGHVPLVAGADVLDKGGKANTFPLINQLLMATLGALLGARGEVDLDLGGGGNHGAQGAAIGDQTRGPGKGPLALQEGRPHLGNNRHLGGPGADVLAADLVGDILPLENHLGVSAVGVHAETDVHVGGQHRQLLDVVEPHLVALGGQGQQPVEGAAVEVMVAEPGRQQLAQGALAGAARAVHGDDRHGLVLVVGGHHALCSSRWNPARLARDTNPGKDVATFWQSLMVIPPRATRPATAKAMAMRWSWWLSITALPMGPPLISMPSGRVATRTPRAARPSAIAWMRSLSLTRSSSAPLSTVVPSAQAAATKSTGNSSMARGT